MIIIHIFAKIIILNHIFIMSKKLTGILLLLLCCFPAMALNELAAEQEANFIVGDLYKCYGAGEGFFGSDADQESNELFSDEDKMIIAFYDLLSKQALGISYSVHTMPVYKYFLSKADENHYMTLIINAIYDSDLKKSVATCDKALEAIADTYGEDSWEYAYMQAIKGQRQVLTGDGDGAQKSFRKYFELNAANGREIWWPDATVYSYLAVQGVINKDDDFASSNFEAATKAIGQMPQETALLLSVVPALNFLYIYQTAGAGDFALEQALNTYKWLEQGGLTDTEIYAYAKQCIGIGYSMTGNQKEALAWFDKAMKDYKRLGIEDCSYATSLKNWTKHAKSKK